MTTVLNGYCSLLIIWTKFNYLCAIVESPLQVLHDIITEEDNFTVICITPIVLTIFNNPIIAVIKNTKK